MEHLPQHSIGETYPEKLIEIVQRVAKIHLERSLTSAELREVLEPWSESSLNQPVKTTWTPPELAREWGISPDKILTWIRSGELRAVNIATTQLGRPRYQIDAEAIESFKRNRASRPAPKPPKKRRSQPGVIEFF